MGNKKGRKKIVKKKKRGFTLVEIIAVIIILGILMIITVPSVSKYIGDTRNSAYHTHEKSMEEAAKSYTIECIKNNEQDCLIPREGEEITVLLGELEDKEFIDKLQDPGKQGTFCNPEESYVKIRKSDAVDYEYIACLYCGAYSTEKVGCAKIEVAPTTIECGTDIRGAGNTWTRDSRTVSINCVDRTNNSCKQERFEKSFGSTMEYGEITIYDSNPSRGTKSCRVPVRIDLEKPTCSLDVSGDLRGSYYVGDVTVTMPATSRRDAHSGVGSYGLGTSSNSPKYDNRETTTVTSNGITRVFGYIKDVVGNEGTCVTSVTKVGKYYIVYDKNTGTGTMADTECIFGENCTLRTNTFTKLGHHFHYWSMLADGNTAKHYSDGEVVKNITFSDSIRLYAIWEKNQNTLVVNANSGTGGFTEKHEYEYQKAINVARTGYTFTSWTASGTCGTYTNAASTTYIYPANRDTTCTLKANWTINNSVLVVDANGGTGSISATTQNYNTTKAISVARTGYTFDGWDASGTCGTYTNAASTTYTFPASSGTTCTLKAKWKINTNSLVVDANGGTGSFASTTQNYNTTKSISVSRTGYTFNGWTKSGTCGSYTNAASTTYTFPANSGTTCTLKAGWTINSNSLVVDANGGTGGFSSTSQNYNTTKAISVSRTGYTFGGWDATGTCGSYTSAASTTYTFPANSGTTCTLKAKWTINTNSLVVDANGGTGGFASTTQNYNTTKSISVSRTGYTFGGWTKTGTCGSYTNAASTTYTFPANSGTTCTLKAKWTINTNSLVVDANGGTGGFSSTTQNYNTTKAISVSRTGYTFSGWTKSGTCGSYTNAASTTYTFPANSGTTCTLKANWTINTNSLLVDANGGTGGFSSTTQNYNTTKSISVSWSKHIFDGWTKSGTCGSYTNAASTTYTFPANSGTTCTLKAKWKTCPGGTYISGTTCKDCEVGYYCNNGDRTACPAGKTSPAKSDEVSDCYIESATFTYGYNLNSKMTTLAGSKDNIKAFARSTTKPGGTLTNVSTNSNTPIYMWYNSGTIYWYSEARTVYMNSSASSLFYNFSNLTNISGVRDINMSKVTNLSNAFQNCSKLTDLSPVANWDVSSVTNMYSTFSGCSSLTSSASLLNWNTKSVTTFHDFFAYCPNLTDLSGLSKFNTSKATDLVSFFFECSKITNVDALANWDLSSAIEIRCMFFRNYSLTNINGLKNWNVSKVQDPRYLFLGAYNLTDISPLRNWNTANFTDMTMMFSYDFYYDKPNMKISSLEPLRNWNTAKVTSVEGMFKRCSNIGSSASYLNGWNTSRMTNKTGAFEGASSSPSWY